MNKEIDNIKKSRVYLLHLISDLSIEQLNEIPAGFSNNIAWNIAHMVAAQQGVCYLRAGIPIVTDEKYWTTYKPGTKPEGFIDADEMQKIKDLLLTTIDRLSEDYGSNMFGNYAAWTTRYGAELSSINDAIAFLPYHEGLHGGAILALMKLVKSKV